MTEQSALDKVLAAHAHNDSVKYFLRATVGLSEEAAADTAAAQGEKFKLDSGVLTFLGKPADKDGIVAWLKDNGRAYLLPTDLTDNNSSGDATAPKLQKGVDAALVAQAKAGNVTAKGRLFVQLGRDQSKLDAILAGEGVDTSSHAQRRETARDALRNDQGQFVADEGAKLAKSHKGVNPWSVEGWNATEQSRIFRANSKLAASLALAANSKIGAAHPTRAA